MQRWQRRQRLPEEAPFGGRCLSPGGKRRCRCGLSRRRPTPSEVGGWGSLGSAGVVPARDPGRAGAQAAHPRRGPVLTASGGRRCASPRGPARGCSSPGRPLCPRQEPGDHGSSRRPQLQPVFVASSRSTARPWLAAPRFARGWGGRLLRGCTHLQRPDSSPGMHRPPQVAKRGGENAPAPPPPARSPGVGGGEAGEQRQPRRRQRAVEARVQARVQPRGPRRREMVRVALGGCEDGPEDGALDVRALELQQGRRAPGSHAPMAPGGAWGLPGPQPQAAWRAPAPRLASGPGAARRAPQAACPALRLPRVPRAASRRSRQPCSPARCFAPVRLTGASARSRRRVSPPARPLRSGPISGGREAVTRVTRRRVLRGAEPGAATRAFRGKIQRPAGRLSNLLPQAGARRSLPREDCNSRHAARRRRS